MLVRLTHKRMELAVSFVAGVMLGVALLHMIPHAFEMRMDALPLAATSKHSGSHAVVTPLMLWLIGGFLTMFFIERFFCFHHHDAPGSEGENTAGRSSGGHNHGHGFDHHHHRDGHGHDHHTFTWTGTAIGLTLHSLVDGVALAASVEAARHASDGSFSVTTLAGLGTFVVIFLHKPFDSLTLGTMMTLGRRSTSFKHSINTAFSLMIVAGVGLFHLGLTAGEQSGGLVAVALAFCAGTFLCISMSDLLPELQFHQHDRGKLSMSLLLGLGVAWAVGALEVRMH